MPGVPYSLLKAACDEGALMLYHGTWSDAQKAQVAQFKTRFPCIKNLQMFELNAGPLRQRFLAESRAGLRVADIIQDTDPGTLNDQAAENLYLDYTISNDAAYADGMKKKGFWYPLRIALIGIAWNTDVVNDSDVAELKDWKNIADPKWKGRAGVVDPAAGGVAYLPWYAWFKLYGEDFIKKIGEVRPQIYSATNPGSAALASGDIAVLFNASETGLMPLQAAGAPLRWTFPEPATGPVTGRGHQRARAAPECRQTLSRIRLHRGRLRRLAEARRRARPHRLQGPAADRVGALVQISRQVLRCRSEGRDGALPEDFGLVPAMDQRAAVTSDGGAAGTRAPARCAS